MSPLASKKAAFIFRYILERSFGEDGYGNYSSTSVSNTITYDNQ